MRIVPAEKSDLHSFFSYLDKQLAENGQGHSHLFHATSIGGKMPESMKEKFKAGFSADFVT